MTPFGGARPFPATAGNRKPTDLFLLHAVQTTEDVVVATRTHLLRPKHIRCLGRLLPVTTVATDSWQNIRKANRKRMCQTAEEVVMAAVTAATTIRRSTKPERLSTWAVYQTT